MLHRLRIPGVLALVCALGLGPAGRAAQPRLPKLSRDAQRAAEIRRMMEIRALQNRGGGSGPVTGGPPVILNGGPAPGSGLAPGAASDETPPGVKPTKKMRAEQRKAEARRRREEKKREARERAAEKKAAAAAAKLNKAKD